MARKTIIAGNWKMNLLPQQGEELVVGLKENLVNKQFLEVVVIPQAPMLALVAEWAFDSTIKFGAQNCSDKISGAYTGETSPELLQILGCSYCLSGHSERRELFGETNEEVGKKSQAIISMNMTPIVCVGESLSEREANQHLEKITKQVTSIFKEVDKQSWKEVVIAYEPIWAIGTGKTASPEQAEEIHKYIRNQVKEIAGEIIAESISILYGGSAKPDNAAILLKQQNIDGLLVGGASLKPHDFSKIIAAFE